MPADIPEHFKIGIETLELGQYLRVADLQEIAGEKVHILSEADGVICHVVTPKVEEEVKPEEEEAAEASEEPELIKKGKTTEEGEEEPKK